MDYRNRRLLDTIDKHLELIFKFKLIMECLPFKLKMKI